MDVRQLLAAIVRWAGVRSMRINFSASAKVCGDTAGPTGGAVLNAGGAPGGRSLGDWACAMFAPAALSNPSDVCFRNLRRDLLMWSLGALSSKARRRVGAFDAIHYLVV